MRYETWYTLSLAHLYYQPTGNIPQAAITLVPTHQSQSLMQRFRLKIIRQGQQFSILRPLADDGLTPLIPIETGARLEFELQLLEKELPLVTDLSPLDLQTVLQGSEYLQFSNETLLAGQFSLPTTRFQPTTQVYFRSQTPALTESFFLSPNPIEGLTAGDFAIAGISGVSVASAYFEEEKRIEVDTSSLTAETRFQVSYRVYNRKPNVFGYVAITNTAILAAMTSPPTFQLALNVLSSDWIYYFVLPNSENRTNITVEDLDTTRTGGVLSFATTDLPPSGNPDPIDQHLANTYTGKSLVKAVSNRSLPYQYASDPSIRLTYSPSVGNPQVFTPLETPSVNQGGNVIFDLTL